MDWICLTKFRRTKLSRTVWLGCQCSQSSRVFAGVPPSLWPRLWFLTFCKCIKHLFRSCCSKVLVKVIIDNHHRCITTSTLAFDFNNGELAILGRRSRFDPAQMRADRIQNIRRPTQHARRGRTHLHKVVAHRFPVEHGVKGGDFVHAHGRHLEEARDVVHDADARPSLVLSLAEIEEGDDGRFFVLGRIPGYDVLCFFHVVGGERKGYLWIVMLGVAVHEKCIRAP